MCANREASYVVKEKGTGSFTLIVLLMSVFSLVEPWLGQ